MKINDDDVVRDGESVRVPVHLMDGLQRSLLSDADARRHQPHFAALINDATQHDRAAARLEWLAHLRDAWKKTPVRDAEPEEPDGEGAPDPGDIRAVEARTLAQRGEESQRRRDAIWTRYRDDLGNAWKASAATAIEREGERWRGGR